MKFDKIYEEAKTKMYYEMVDSSHVCSDDMEKNHLAKILQHQDDGTLNDYFMELQEDIEKYNKNKLNPEEFFKSLVVASDDEAAVLDENYRILIEEKEQLEKEVINIVKNHSDKMYAANQDELEDLSKEKSIIEETTKGIDEQILLLNEKIEAAKKDISEYSKKKLEYEEDNLKEREADFDRFKVCKDEVRSSKASQLEIQLGFRELCKLHKAYNEDFNGLQRAFSFLSWTKAHDYKEKLDKLDDLFLKRSGVTRKDFNKYFSTGLETGTLYDKLHYHPQETYVEKAVEEKDLVENKENNVEKNDNPVVNENIEENNEELDTSAWLDDVMSKDGDEELDKSAWLDDVMSVDGEEEKEFGPEM